MKNILIFLSTCFPILLLSQVSDKDWEHDKSKDIIIIKYNLNKIDKYNFYDIKVTGTVDGVQVPINSVSGDIGKLIKVGSSKVIKWNVLDDVSELKGEFNVNVIAIQNPEGVDIPTHPKVNVNKTPLWIGLGGSVAAGGALIVVGILKVSDGKDMYKIYEDNKYEYDEVFGDKTRTEYYDEADSKYKTGVFLSTAGAAIVAAGGIYFINKILKADKKGKVAFNLIPIQNYHNGSFDTRTSGMLASMTIRF